jgi:hypothetical protein
MGEVEKLEGVPYELSSRQDVLPTQCSEVVVTSFTNECTALSSRPARSRMVVRPNALRRWNGDGDVGRLC